MAQKISYCNKNKINNPTVTAFRLVFWEEANYQSLPESVKIIPTVHPLPWLLSFSVPLFFFFFLICSIQKYIVGILLLSLLESHFWLSCLLQQASALILDLCDWVSTASLGKQFHNLINRAYCQKVFFFLIFILSFPFLDFIALIPSYAICITINHHKFVSPLWCCEILQNSYHVLPTQEKLT